jgi:hypothetical protein
MAIIPARVLVPRLKAIGEGMFEAAGEVIPDSLYQRVTNAGLWTGILLNNALFLGIVFLMTVKPDLIGSLATIIVAALAGVILAAIWKPVAQPAGAHHTQTPAQRGA